MVNRGEELLLGFFTRKELRNQIDGCRNYVVIQDMEILHVS